MPSQARVLELTNARLPPFLSERRLPVEVEHNLTPSPAEPSRPEPAFDAAAMTRLLDGDQREVRQTVRRLLSEEMFRYEYGLDQRAYREKVVAWCRHLATRGLGALAYPKDFGGADDPVASIAAAEILGFHDLSLAVKFGVQFGLFGDSIHRLGTENHHRRYLLGVSTMELVGCFAMTETDHGSNVGGIETVARYDRATREFVIHTPHEGARKDYIGNAALHARLAVVFAQLEIDDEPRGVHAFLVTLRDAAGKAWPGVRIEDCGGKMGLNGVDNGRLGFDQVRVPRSALLDHFAQVGPDGTYTSSIASPTKRFFTMLGTLVKGRVIVGQISLSTAKSALTIAVRYGARRRQFGSSAGPETVLLDYLTHQRRLMPRLAATYALDFSLKHLADRFAVATADDRDIETLAAGLKAIASWHATDTIQTCREACGARGYLAIHRFADLKADSDIFTTFEGDNTVLLQLVAKALLTSHQRKWAEINVFDLTRYLAGRAASAMSPLCLTARSITAAELLRGREFQLQALRWRERHLLDTLSRRLKRRIDDGMESFHALIECQDHLLALARAHIERMVVEQFAAAIQRTAEAPLAEMLETLCDLYALWRIESDRGWFLEQGYMSGATAKAIRKLVNKLCGEVRMQALPLVEAFGIPDALLGTPMLDAPIAPGGCDVHGR